ncbi:MAG: AI-2E family transporter [Holosporales bacterium]|jgi:predicted PurR-regulated permease PerM|nr:AI-2E family transporter [Holosporales bacterium]
MQISSFFQKFYSDEKYFRATILSIIVLSFFSLFLWKISHVLISFIFAFTISAILNPYVKKLQNIGIPRMISVALLLLILISAIIVFFMVLSFYIHKHFVYYSEHINETISFISDWIPNKINLISQKLHIPIEINSTRIKEYLMNSFGTITRFLIRYSSSLFDHAKAIIGVFSSAFIISILSFYILKDWLQISVKIKMYIPNKFLDFVMFAMPAVKTSLKKQVGGQARVCVCMAALYVIGLGLLGIKPFFLIGILSGILTFIPFIGGLIAFLCAFFIGLGQNLSLFPMIFIILIYFVGSSTESNFLTPKFVGNEVGIHPIWIFFAILTMLALFGISGAIFVMPLTAIITSLLKSFTIWIRQEEFH